MGDCNPQISVVIPTYNGSAFLKAAVDSVVSQTRAAKEIIIVDDFSKDGTYELAKLIGGKCGIPTRVIRLAQNSGGPAVPLAIGFEQANGDYISVLDQDDLFFPN